MPATRSAAPAPALRGNAVALVSTVLWASSFPATEYLLRGWDPLLLCARSPRPAPHLFLVLLALLTGRARELVARPGAMSHLLGALGVAAPVFLIVLGPGRSDAVTVAIISTTLPLISALMAWALDGRRPSAAVAVWHRCSPSSAAASPPSADPGGPDGPRGGEVLVLGAMIAWIWYSRAALRRLAGLGDLALSGLTFAAGARWWPAVAGWRSCRSGWPRRRLALDPPHLAVAAVDEHDRDRPVGAACGSPPRGSWASPSPRSTPTSPRSTSC